MKVGDRVKHDYLGKGTVVEYPIRALRILALVKWDKTPSIRYNMGENPCVISVSELLVANSEGGR